MSGIRRKLAIMLVGLLSLAMAYHVLFGHDGVIAYQHKRKESRELQQQNEQLRQENEALQKQIKALKDDPEAIEKEARERLRYARPGEVIYTLPQAKPSPSSVSAK
ncbi:MAG TPA: septum formation initiator family protein [Candidatus Angelobacter sp.]|nr:septum formation initiator family protein [Candidatus Angelobacter sp.]